MEKRDIIAGLGVIATAEALAWYGLYPSYLGIIMVFLITAGTIVNIDRKADIILKKMCIYFVVISFFLTAITVANDSTFVVWWQKVVAFIIGFCIDLAIIWGLYKIYHPLFKKIE